MDRIHDRLVEAGLVNYWLKELFDSSTKKARDEKREEERRMGTAGDGAASLPSEVQRASQSGDGAVVLNLNHLQGAFYILLLGYSSAFLVLLTEKALSGDPTSTT
nr:uncharacterized protein LOC128693313 [Cherax quadricarinatus]